MRYTFETTYDQKALTAMAKCVRKTVRRKRSRRSHVLGWIVAALGILFPFIANEDGIDFKKIVTWTAAAVMVLALLFEDRLNAYVAKRRMIKGSEKANAVFDTEAEGTFVSETAVGKTEFPYTAVLAVAETQRYFVFMLSTDHAQVYDKNTLAGGTADAFREFIAERTGRSVVPVS
ncbi:MAG: YcxB family protein [Oscillospiraceae bacterium]|nr:YcxB family protein [Oscillospiraceae bacterium]